MDAGTVSIHDPKTISFRLSSQNNIFLWPNRKVVIDPCKY